MEMGTRDKTLLHNHDNGTEELVRAVEKLIRIGA
jgi:hypothetical protein